MMPPPKTHHEIGVSAPAHGRMLVNTMTLSTAAIGKLSLLRMQEHLLKRCSCFVSAPSSVRRDARNRHRRAPAGVHFQVTRQACRGAIAACIPATTAPGAGNPCRRASALHRGRGGRGPRLHNLAIQGHVLGAQLLDAGAEPEGLADPVVRPDPRLKRGKRLRRPS